MGVLNRLNGVLNTAKWGVLNRAKGGSKTQLKFKPKGPQKQGVPPKHGVESPSGVRMFLYVFNEKSYFLT